MFGITPSARLRPSPYYQSTLNEGVTAFTTYNNMLMPTSYGKSEEEYWRLLKGVSQWDVACERQVQLTGPDAGRLTNRVWSYRLKRNIGFGLVTVDCVLDDRIELHRQGQAIGGWLTSVPFV